MGGRAGIAVAVACAAQFLIGVDGLGVAIALPAIQEDFGARPVDGQWVLTAYGLCFGGGLLLCGRLGDLAGRRRMLIVGMALFGAGAVAAAARRRWACWSRRGPCRASARRRRCRPRSR
jgi:MFS family permease